jgi:hypothetical protein
MKAGNLAILAVVGVVAYLLISRARAASIVAARPPTGTVTAPTSPNTGLAALLGGLSGILSPGNQVPNNQANLVGYVTQAANRDQVVTPNYIDDISLATGVDSYQPPGAGTLNSSVTDPGPAMDLGNYLLGNVT